MTHNALSILIINDNREEIEVIKASIRSFAPNSLYVVAYDERSLIKRMTWLDYHLVICDHQLPDDLAQRANLRLRVQLPYLPFILITSSPEMKKGIFCPESSSWSIRAIIDRNDLGASGKIMQSIFNNSAEMVERERSFQIKTRQKSLLMQKFDCLLKKALQPINAFHLEELSHLLFVRQKFLENPIP